MCQPNNKVRDVKGEITKKNAGMKNLLQKTYKESTPKNFGAS